MADVYVSEPVRLVLRKLRSKGASEQTLKRFELYVKKFCSYLSSHGKSWKQASCDDVVGYLASLDACGNTKFTIFYALRSIFGCWGLKWTLEKGDAPKPSTPKRPWYSDNDVLKIVSTADKVSVKAGALVRIGRDCGCRRSAIFKMNREDFLDLKPPVLKVPPVKHGEYTDIEIGEDTANALRGMLSRRDDSDKALFVGEGGVRMSLAQLSNLFHDVCKYAGVYKNRAGIHALRRAKVTRLRKAGFDEFDITGIMGWKPGSNMLHTYCQLDKSDLQHKAAKADPLMKKDEGEEND